MAMIRIVLRTVQGEDVHTHETVATAYPDIVNREDKSYVLRRLMSDKKTAYYVEATTLDL